MQRYNSIRNENDVDNIPRDLYVITEKIHGTNCRIGLKKVRDNPSLIPHYGSRNQVARFDQTLGHYEFGDWVGEKGLEFWESLESKATSASESELEEVVLFGEWYGPNIPGGVEIDYSSERGFVVFDMCRKVDGEYVWTDWDEIHETAKELDLETVPEMFYVANPSLDDPEKIMQMQPESILASKNGKDDIMEGVIIRHKGSWKGTNFDERPIYKVKSEEYKDRKYSR